MCSILCLDHDARSPIHLSKDHYRGGSQSDALTWGCQREQSYCAIGIWLKFFDCLMALFVINSPINTNVGDILLHYEIFQLIQYFVVMRKQEKLCSVFNECLNKWLDSFYLSDASQCICFEYLSSSIVGCYKLSSESRFSNYLSIFCSHFFTCFRCLDIFLWCRSSICTTIFCLRLAGSSKRTSLLSLLIIRPFSRRRCNSFMLELPVQSTPNMFSLGLQ